MSFQVAFPDDMPDSAVALIGKIAIAFGQLEYTLGIALKRERGLSLEQGLSEAEAIISRPELCERIAEAQAIRVMNQDLERTMEGALGQVKYVNRLRNELLHGCWARFPDGALMHRPPRGSWSCLDERKLIALARDIRTVRDNLALIAGEKPSAAPAEIVVRVSAMPISGSRPFQRGGTI